MTETDPNPYKQFTPENLQYARAFTRRLIEHNPSAEWVGRLFENYGMLTLEMEQRDETE